MVEEGTGSSLGSLLGEPASHSGGLHTHDLITSQRPHLLMLSAWGLGFQHMNFEVTQTSRPQQVLWVTFYLLALSQLDVTFLRTGTTLHCPQDLASGLAFGNIPFLDE